VARFGGTLEANQSTHSSAEPLMSSKRRMAALFAAKSYIEQHLCDELNLFMVQVPLIVDVASGVNDMLDRDGSRTPIQFHIHNDGSNTIDAQVVQAATKWKRPALAQFGCEVGEGICTDMKAVRKDYFLDHDHSARPFSEKPAADLG
jgi:aspartate--ammonia ligase